MSPGWLSLWRLVGLYPTSHHFVPLRRILHVRDSSSMPKNARQHGWRAPSAELHPRSPSAELHPRSPIRGAASAQPRPRSSVRASPPAGSRHRRSYGRLTCQKRGIRSLRHDQAAPRGPELPRPPRFELANIPGRPPTRPRPPSNASRHNLTCCLALIWQVSTRAEIAVGGQVRALG